MYGRGEQDWPVSSRDGPRGEGRTLMSALDRVRGAFIDAYLGPRLQRTARGWRGLARRLGGGTRRPTFYFQADDPHSYLLAQLLPELVARYPLDLEVVVVPAPAADVDPEPALRRDWAAKDAALLAQYFELDFPTQWTLPDENRLRRVDAVLLRDRPAAEQLQVCRALGAALWRGDGEAIANAVNRFGAVAGQDVRPLLERNYERLRRHGHYIGGMLAYEGEWYWGPDRIGYLDERLRGEGLSGDPSPLLRARPEEDVPPPAGVADADGRVRLDVYLSFRSPYSYLVLPRLRALTERYPELELRLRPVLPMVMRGLPVPKRKRLYLARDAKREARRWDVPFGRLCDPLGAGVERCLAVWARAEERGRGLAFFESACVGIWSEAVNVATDAGLLAVAERAGLEPADVDAALADEGWRAAVERHRDELRELGLWGVPSFRQGQLVAWGQDRLFVIEDRLRRHFAR